MEIRKETNYVLLLSLRENFIKKRIVYSSQRTISNTSFEDIIELTLQSFKDDVLDELFHFLNKQLDSSLRGMFNEKTNVSVSLH